MIRSTLSLSRLCIVALTVFLLAIPALSYEEDTHFQMTYVICRSVGFTADEALIVAAADQGMDDSPNLVANGGPLGIEPQVEQEWRWHALDKDGKMKAAGVIARRNQLLQDALKEGNFRNKLIRLGIFFHYQQDTWAHRHHYEPNHLSRDAYTTYNTPFGHAADFHQPDRPPYDPVAALMDLEDGIGIARYFLRQIGRAPNAFLADYTPQGGTVDTTWARKAERFNQISLAGAAPHSARMFLLSLIRAQIDQYKSSGDAKFPANEADLYGVRAALANVCRDFEPYRSAGIIDPVIAIPTRDEKAAAGFTKVRNGDLLGDQLMLTSAITDGMHVEDDATGDVYLAIDGTLRRVSVKDIGNLFAPATMAKIFKMSQYTIGAPLKEGAYLAYMPTGPSASQQYLIINGTRRLIPNAATFDRYGFASSKVRLATEDELKKFTAGPILNNPGWPAIASEGKRIRTPSDGKIYLVIDNQLRWIPNEPTYNGLFILGAGITDIPTANGYLVGPPLSGAYLAKPDRGDGIYFIEGGKKRFLTQSAIYRFSFDKAKIKTVPAGELANMPDGPNLPYLLFDR
jgi:hypothetical protein